MSPLRQLPAVGKVLDHPALVALRGRYSAEAITSAVRIELDRVRDRLKAGEAGIDPDSIASNIVVRLRSSEAPVLRTVINATGIVLHTNLGRSPLAEVAALAAYEAARGYLNLELDLGTGKRSSRQDPIRAGVVAITGAEAATVVNNCAAATVIVLRALAAGKEVIVSRGQLIEIGGNFRIPEIMAASGAILREVGTTNITRLVDYERAIGPNTGLLMRIHTSNFRVRGFTESVGIGQLAALGNKCGIAVIDDAGSGAVLDWPDEPQVSQGIAAGADLVLFSGDKLLGGPQAGIIAGKAELIATIERDPLMRAFRCDKMTLAALETTLQLHRNPERIRETIPTLAMLTMPLATLRKRAEAFAVRLRTLPEIRSLGVRDDVAFVGGGSLPDVALPTVVIALTAVCHSEDAVAARLRSGTPAVMARIHAGKVVFDLRTVFDRQLDDLFAAISVALREESP